MASPQTENGYTIIASEILDVLSRTCISSLKLRIIMAILRYTYGYNRKEASIRISYIANYVNSSLSTVSKEINKLVEMKIIERIGDVFRFNKDYDEWIIDLSEKKTCSSEQRTIVPVYGNTCANEQRTIVPEKSSDCSYAQHEVVQTDNESCSINQPINTNINTNINTTIKKTERAYARMLADAVDSWCEYKKLTPNNIYAFTSLINVYRERFSDTEIAMLIIKCQSEGCKCVYWNRLEQKEKMSQQATSPHNYTSL